MEAKFSLPIAAGAVALSSLDGGLTYGIITGAMGAGAFILSENHAKNMDKELKAGDPESVAFKELLDKRKAHKDCSILLGVTTILCPILGLSAILVQSVVKTVVEEAITTKAFTFDKG